MATSTHNAPIYSDINLWVGKFSNDLIVHDYDAINQNIFLIVTTPIRSKWFDPFLGSNIPKYLFEPMDDITASDIKTEIGTLLTRNLEYRVKIENVRVIPNYDMQVYGVEVNYVCDELSNASNQFRFALNKQQS